MIFKQPYAPAINELILRELEQQGLYGLSELLQQALQ